MPPTIGSRFRSAWDAFRAGGFTSRYRENLGPSTGSRPDKIITRYGSERTIAQAIFTRIALDVAAIAIQHVQLDESGRYIDTIQSSLSDCFNVSANIDQTGKELKRDLVISLLEEGAIAIVPIKGEIDKTTGLIAEIHAIRTAQIKTWYPNDVELYLYNEDSGIKENIVLPKRAVGIIENPLYAVINDPNSTLKRLIRKLTLLDVVDNQTSSGKLDLIIQLPYTIKSEMRRQQADQRRKEMERQLVGSKYGIAYADATEKITQLNRPVENNLMAQIEYLTAMLYSQLGLTQSILDGTADDTVMTNYFSRTVRPFATAIADELHRKYLTEQQRLNHEAIQVFSDPFGFVPVSKIAEISDTLTRNEILSSNEVRQILGMKASDDPGADELRNKNLSMEKTEAGQRKGQSGTEIHQNGG